MMLVSMMIVSMMHVSMMLVSIMHFFKVHVFMMHLSMMHVSMMHVSLMHVTMKDVSLMRYFLVTDERTRQFWELDVFSVESVVSAQKGVPHEQTLLIWLKIHGKYGQNNDKW